MKLYVRTYTLLIKTEIICKHTYIFGKTVNILRSSVLSLKRNSTYRRAGGKHNPGVLRNRGGSCIRQTAPSTGVLACRLRPAGWGSRSLRLTRLRQRSLPRKTTLRVVALRPPCRVANRPRCLTGAFSVLLQGQLSNASVS